MSTRLRWVFVCVVAWLTAVVASAEPALRVVDLSCEYGVQPMGLDVAEPRLFWRVEGTEPAERGQRQTAWQVLVASSLVQLIADRGDLWDSGRIAGDQTTHVRYAGAPLVSSQEVFWKVRAWDRDGRATEWSHIATWTMGLLQPQDWKARWIVAPWTSESLLLRKEFRTRGQVRRALLHVCGLGHYEASLNGEKVGNDLFSPGWTDYDETTLYETRDISATMRTGTNVIGLTLGNGMYHVVRRDRFAKFTGSHGPLRAIAQLELEYADGSRDLVVTDDSWRVHPGGITYNSIYGGEDFDARRYPRGWDAPGFDDASWARAVYVVRPAMTTLRGYRYASEPVREIERRQPVSVRELGEGVALYDLGQNASFMPAIRVSGPPGATVRLTPGEVVKADGTIERGTMGGAHRGSAWWSYTKATDGVEEWFPQFYYVGSRYLYVESWPAAEGGARPKLESVEGVIVHAVARPLGHFATSNPRLNAIRDLVRWAQRSNLVSVLTDCPHREKLGWIEQYHLNGPSIRYEFDVARSFTKGMHDMAAAQTEEGLVPNIAPEFTEFKGVFRGAAEWGAAFLLVPWQQYLFTGDTELLREHYPAMQRYLAYLESRTQDGLLADGLGDWYDLLLGKKGRANLTPAPITATAFLYHDTETLARIAGVLGKPADASRYAARAAEIRARYQREFFHAEDGSYGSGSQASLAIPLVMGLPEETQRARLLELLVRDVEERGYASAGDIGFRYLLLALADAGRSDVIYRLINQDEKPGYGYQLKQGATALTEAWDANLGASHNHFMLGQVIEWFYRDLAGIDADPAAPGFRHFFVRPQPVGDLTWVEASYDSIHGGVAVRWERPGAADGKPGPFVLELTVPTNTTATVLLPARGGATVREGGKALSEVAAVREVRREGDRVMLEVESGSYEFTTEF